MRRRHLLSASLLSAVCLSLGLVPDAAAKNDKWPPPETATAADLATPTYWPDDPDYGYLASGKIEERRKGEWNLFGFQPDRSPNAGPLRPDEVGKPSGMSADLAWRYTIGDPRVSIAILDSGIKWDDRELATKAFLNIRELAGHRPHDAQGKDCGGDGDLAGFDCNGDGFLSVADYADDPSLTPDATTEGTQTYPRGDRNHNGVLDAGDLILAFSDGVDDDGNGYVDDISGWDFLMDDNDPYEDTRFYHGTTQARNAAGEGNNGQGGIGVCPGCRVIWLRVGDSFVTDSSAYAKAVVYATDNDVGVIECALGTINMSAYARAAVEYAYTNKRLVVASMADENSKHQNLPNTSNYTLQVHAIVNNGAEGDVTSADSMLAFDPGTNYGGQNFLSAPSEGASSGATAVTSGAAGLVVSAALKYGKYPLSAPELSQLFTMTADDINVPESQVTDPRYYWSQPGFDQRFGYGRVNVNTAVEWVKAGRIPPEVTVTAPAWFDNLYSDQQKGPVELRGTIAAPRATSYDYAVEWGPGVQPLDTEFHAITSKQNVDGATVSGGQEPLALLDLATIDPTHTRDRDSQAGENDAAFTVRVRVTAHYGGDIGDVPGEMRRTYYNRKDPDLLPGFPIRLPASGESSPKLYDLDGDGKREIVIADAGGNIHAFRVTNPPVEMPGFPFRVKRMDGLEADPITPGTVSYLAAKGYASQGVDPDIAREPIFATVAVADMDGDGQPEIAATTYNGTIYVINHDGTLRAGWPQRLPYVPSCPLDPNAAVPDLCMSPSALVARGAAGSPVLIDMNKDGKLDLVQAAFDGKVYAFDGGGAALPGWPVTVHFPDDTVPSERARLMTTPAVADLNGDGIPEVMVGSSERLGDGGSTGAFYVIDGRGTLAPGASGARAGYLPNWPVTVASLDILPLIGQGVTNAGAFGDFDGDGVPEVVMHGNVSAPIILPADPGPQKSLGSTPPNALPKTTDEDGTVHRGVAPTSVFGELSKARTPDTMFPLFAQPSLGDLDLDGTLDVAASGGSLSLAANLASKGSAQSKPAQFLLGMWSGKTGKMMPGAPVPLEDFTFINNLAIADITGDGFPEVLTGTGAYLVHAVDACGREAEGWPKNTGQWVMATVAVGDLDGDNLLEAVVSSRAGYLYAWHTKGHADGVVQWESFHHDSQNTGNYATKLGQGVPFKASGALDCGASTTGGPTTPVPAAAADPPDTSGGCGVGVGVASPGGSGSLAGLLGLVAAGLLGRRRRGSRAA
jgi:hypothetical protein